MEKYISKIEKEFDEQFVYKQKREDGSLAYEEWIDRDNVEEVKSFLKQSFIKYLHGEVERLDGELRMRYNQMAFDECDKMLIRLFLTQQIDHYKAQIKELEK